MIKAVLDTNVLVRALINPHSRCGRLLSQFAEDYVLVLSPAIIREVLDVLYRSSLRAKFPQISKLDVAHIISLFAQAEVVEPTSLPTISRDPDDDKFLACAEIAAADYLVTEGKDLLVLDLYKSTHICQPAEFITLFESDEFQIK
jgi:putative PIN family toxin of toxin-antitoxin system